MKISHKVPLVSTAVIAASFSIFSYIQYNVIKSTIYEQTASRLAEVSTLLGQNVGSWLTQRLDLVQGIAEIARPNPTVDNLRYLLSVPRFNESVSYFYGAYDSDGIVHNDLQARMTPPGI